jgi:hypothetical protein
VKTYVPTVSMWFNSFYLVQLILTLYFAPGGY